MCVAGLVFYGRARATQYDLVMLNTVPFNTGQAFGVYHGQVVGAGFRGALLWTTPSTPVDLSPGSAYRGSTANGIWQNQEVGVGYTTAGDVAHALLWTGSAASVVDLSPPGNSAAFATATDGTQQVGFADGSAALWSGTAQSLVRLNPAPYFESTATGVWNGIQVGFGGSAPSSDALLWHGTASSVVLLRSGAEALGISRGQVVGFAGASGTNVAALWANATPDSFANLAPANATASELHATNGVQQVGDVSVTEGAPGLLPLDHHPGVWHGTPSSFQLLPLPQGDNFGYATGIDGDGNISGYVGTQNAGSIGNFLPALWAQRHFPGDADFDGVVNFSDLTVLAAHYGRPGEWVDGDFNGDGIVNFADLVTLAQNYGKSAPTGEPYSITVPIPEPGAFALLSTVALLALRRPRR